MTRGNLDILWGSCREKEINFQEPIFWRSVIFGKEVLKSSVLCAVKKGGRFATPPKRQQSINVIL